MPCKVVTKYCQREIEMSYLLKIVEESNKVLVFG